MITKPNAHGLCPGVVPEGSHPKTFNFERTIMEVNKEFLLRYKSDYLEFSHEITKLRNDGDKVPQSLLLKAITAGCLADVPEDELNALVSDLKKQ